jgi:hypothetical protein
MPCMPAATTVAQGDSVTLEVPLVMPRSPGKQHFSARMVQEGVAWFGSTAIADIDVVSSAAGTPDGGAGGEASTSGGTSGGLGPGAEPKDSASAGCGCREASGSDDVSGAAKGILFSAFLIAIALRARKGSAANEQR